MIDKRWLALLTLIFVGGVVGGGRLIGAPQAPNDPAPMLVDVTEAGLQDGWGKEAVRTLSMYYTAEASRGDVQMLSYRASLLPVFDWNQGRIDTATASDLYEFYASGAGASRVQFAEDPAYALRYRARYQEPAGRLEAAADAGYALSLGASQSRVVTSDYQNWQDAGLGTASGIDAAGLETLFHTTSRYGGFGASLTRYEQRIKDTEGLTQLSRKAWQTAPDAVSAVWAGRSLAYNSALPSTLTPPSTYARATALRQNPRTTQGLCVEGGRTSIGEKNNAGPMIAMQMGRMTKRPSKTQGRKTSTRLSDRA